MASYLISAPSVEPITLSEAKTHLYEDSTDHDTYINNLITTARIFCEQFQSLCYITQTWDVIFDTFPERIFELPKAPLQSVVSIKYFDKNNVEYTFDASNYYVDIQSKNGRISLNKDVYFPDVELRPINSFIIRCVAGYGNDASSVPSTIKQAMLLLIAHWFENREPVHKEMKLSQEIAFSLTSLLSQNKKILI